MNRSPYAFPQGASTRRSFRPLTWWLHLTSTGWQTPPRSFAETERARRSRLASLIFLGFLIAGFAFLAAGTGDVPTFLAIVGAMFGVAIACLLNRLGFVAVAAIIVPLVLMAAVFGALLSAPDGQLTPDYVPTYDVLVLAVVVAGSLLTPAAAFYMAIINSVAIALDFLVLQPGWPGSVSGKAYWPGDRRSRRGFSVGQRNDKCRSAGRSRRGTRRAGACLCSATPPA